MQSITLTATIPADWKLTLDLLDAVKATQTVCKSDYHFCAHNGGNCVRN